MHRKSSSITTCTYWATLPCAQLCRDENLASSQTTSKTASSFRYDHHQQYYPVPFIQHSVSQTRHQSCFDNRLRYCTIKSHALCKQMQRTHAAVTLACQSAHNSWAQIMAMPEELILVGSHQNEFSLLDVLCPASLKYILVTFCHSLQWAWTNTVYLTNRTIVAVNCLNHHSEELQAIGSANFI